MRRKILFIVGIILAMTFAFAGCGSDTAEASRGGISSVDLSQIDWNVESGIVDGYRCVVFGYTNNTEYEIVDFNLEFKVKDGVTNEQLGAYSELKEKASDMDHDISEITIGAMTSKCVAPGESVEGCACNLDGTIEYYSDFESYEVFEPDMMTAVLSDGKKIYIAYYDFASGKTTMGDQVENAYTWSDSDLAKALPKPDVRYLMISYDEEDSLSANAYGVSKDMYDTYVEACKSKGFDQNIDTYEGSFEADNGEGIHIDVDYYSSDDEMYISAEKDE